MTLLEGHDYVEQHLSGGLLIRLTWMFLGVSATFGCLCCHYMSVLFLGVCATSLCRSAPHRLAKCSVTCFCICAVWDFTKATSQSRGQHPPPPMCSGGICILILTLFLLKLHQSGKSASP